MLWTGATYPNGYGKVYREAKAKNGKRRRKTLLAHRVVYERHHGPAGDKLVVHNRHCSGDKRCIEPSHLSKVKPPRRMKEWQARNAK